MGVYLPISASTPIWIGGMVRWFVDKLSKDRSEAESEMSPGVLLSSGLIAGGAIAGMVLAIIAGRFEDFSRILDLSDNLGFFAASDLVPMLIFALLAFFVFLVGREKLLKARK